MGTDPDGGSTFLLFLPSGYGRPEERAAEADYPNGRFERHSCHEEIFNLSGQYRFGQWYDFPQLGYLNHPPNWVHPADQATDTGALLLIKNSGPVDFKFSGIPLDWDGVEGVDLGDGHLRADSGGVTMIDPGRAEWSSVLDSAGQSSGMLAKTLWADPASGWVTWLMQVPPGWQDDSGTVERCEGGDEMYLLAGDWTHPEHGRLEAEAYYCDPGTIVVGGESSSGGCLAIRWTRSLPRHELPNQVPHISVAETRK